MNLLGARVLFSDLRVSDLFDPFVRGNRAALERHHLYPRRYLATQGITSSRDVNQVANFALVEWPDNAVISGRAPFDYAPGAFQRLKGADREKMLFWHALSDGWWTLNYQEFLSDRRRKIANVIRAGYDRIGQADVEPGDALASSLTELIALGEGQHLEYKSSARWNLKEARPDERIELAMLKSVAGFLNSGGGTLLIGVDDSGKPVGVGTDYATLRKKDADGFQLWLTDLLTRALGKAATTLVQVKVEKYQEREIARVTVRSSPVLVYLNPPKGERVDDVYYRFGNSTRKLTPKETAELKEQGAWASVSSSREIEVEDFQDEELDA